MKNTLSPEQYLKEFQKLTQKMINITTKKNHDYSGNKYAFKNFETISFLSDNQLTPEEGLLVRITDKITRITNLLYSENKVKDEKIEDTLLDLANYALILNIYIKTGPKSQ